MENNGFRIGGIDVDTVKELTAGIVTILTTPHVDNATRQVALKVLHKGVNSGNYANISGCSVTMSPVDKESSEE